MKIGDKVKYIGDETSLRGQIYKIIHIDNNSIRVSVENSTAIYSLLKADVVPLKSTPSYPIPPSLLSWYEATTKKLPS